MEPRSEELRRPELGPALSSQQDELSPEQQKCRLRRLNICETNMLWPVLPGRTLCYCYAEELSDEEGMAKLAEGFRLSRAIALAASVRLRRRAILRFTRSRS